MSIQNSFKITPKSIWATALEVLEADLNAYSFDVWVSHLVPDKIENNRLIILAPTESNYKVVNDNYLNKIRNAVEKQGLFVNDVEIRFGSTLIEDEILSKENDNKKQTSEAGTGISLISRYTFDSFVVGDSNKFVHAAAMAVAKHPGIRYNPLFVYGGVGLGKTHIMHAIGNYIHEHNPEMKLVYTTSERFTNEFIDSLRSDQTAVQKFKENYRSADVLMIDDVQFFENKPSVQEQLFHTFNDLHNDNRQIIMTSDRIPRDIPSLEERLRTRFEWGIIADVQPPSIETKVAILRMKADEQRLLIPDDVIYLIAERVESNIREMESLLSRVALYAKMMGEDISIELANDSLKDYTDHRKAQTSADSIIEATCKYFNITRDDITSKKKTKDIVLPRQIAMFLILEFLSMPLASIGQIFGGRDHTTIIHARDKITQKLKTDSKLVAQVNDIRNMIHGN